VSWAVAVCLCWGGGREQIGDYGVGLVGSHVLTGQGLAKVPPVRGDDEKYARERKRYTCDDRSGGGELELRDLRRGQPDSSEQDEQEADFRKASAGVMRQSEGVHVWHLSCPAPPVSRHGPAAGTPEMSFGVGAQGLGAPRSRR
jgi:hypothetical protein